MKKSDKENLNLIDQNQIWSLEQGHSFILKTSNMCKP